MEVNKKRFIIANIFIWMFFGITLLVGVMPKTPLKIDKDLKNNIKLLLPSRWPFFTKDPREAHMYIFEKQEEQYNKHANFPNSSANNLFGLINYQKAVGLEYGMIANQIDADLWMENQTGESLLNIIDKDSIKTIKVRKTKEYTALEGEYVFAVVEPVPYLWRNKVKPLEMPSKYIKVIIE